MSAAASALVISASTIGLAVGVIPWSMTADHIGRVRAMAIAMTAATVFGLCVPFAPNFELLLGGRLIEGLMVGGVPAIAIAYLSEEVNARHAARVAGTYIAGTTVGGLLGRIVAGPVADLSGWRIGVFTVAVLCAIAAALFIWLAPRSRGFVPQRLRGPDPAGSLWHRLGIHVRSPVQLALYAQALLLMGAFVATYNYLGFRLMAEPFDLAPALVSLIFIAYLAGTWSSAQAGALAGRFGRLTVLIASSIVMLGGVALTVSSLLPVVLAGLLVATAGFFGAHAVASGWTGAAATTGRAQASSLYTLFYYIGSSVFGWLGGVFFASDGWYGLSLMVGALVVAAMLLALLLLRAPDGDRS